MRIEFDITPEEEVVLRRIHEENREGNPDRDLMGTAKAMFGMAIVTATPEMLDRFAAFFGRKLVEQAAAEVAKNPEIVKDMLDAMKKKNEEDARKFAKDKVKKD